MSAKQKQAIQTSKDSTALVHKRLLFLAFLSALFYNAWILAYCLNPRVLTSELLSALEALDQPYHLVFTISDILAAICCLLLSWRLFQGFPESSKKSLFLSIESNRKRKKGQELHFLNFRKQKLSLHKLVFLFMAAFASLTGLAAIFPYPNIKILQEGIPNPLSETASFFHDGLSVLALACLLLAMLVSTKIYPRKSLFVIVLIFLLTAIQAALEGIFPDTFGPWGQQVNSLTAAVWLILITWIILHDKSLRVD